jgi:ABC-type uncharacterized transport system permease subunit
MDEVSFLNLAIIPYLLATGYSCYTWGAKAFRAGKTSLICILVGFILQTIFLMKRGEVLHRCPITTVLEISSFLSWSIALQYLIVGSSFRLSLLGIFSAPLILCILLFGLLYPETHLFTEALSSQASYALEWHATMVLLAYGSFTLATAAAIIYLVQDHFLKTKQDLGILQRLPSLYLLGISSFRLHLMGFLLLTGSILSILIIPRYDTTLPAYDWHHPKILLSIIVWCSYAFILSARSFSKMSYNRFSWIAIGAFAGLTLSFMFIR